MHRTRIVLLILISVGLRFEQLKAQTIHIDSVGIYARVQPNNRGVAAIRFGVDTTIKDFGVLGYFQFLVDGMGNIITTTQGNINLGDYNGLGDAEYKILNVVVTGYGLKWDSK